VNLAAELATGGTVTRLTFTPGGDGQVTVTGDGGQEQLPLGHAPNLISALFEVHPTNFEDTSHQLHGDELDALVDGGTARMLVLGDADAAEDTPPLLALFHHDELGYVAVDEVDGDQLTLRTLRSLDVWAVICEVTAAALLEN
jgi:hypothetical protein